MPGCTPPVDTILEIKAEKITPYGENRSKGSQVEAMFDNIAPAYDFMNRLMTLGVDRTWRRKVVKLATDLPSAPHPELLDVATGTADLAISLAEAAPRTSVTGVDLSEGMLAIGRKKVEGKGLTGRLTLRQADCLTLPFPAATFDAVTVAFGVRNFEHLDRGYHEMAHVLKPGGRLIVLELSVPSNPVVKPFYRFYTRVVIPLAGRLISKDSSAYTYLPKSIAAMPQGEKMLKLMEDAGLTNATLRRLTFGVATIYTAIKAN